uniref:Uncharacterized protein n=1 Tax=Glossina palpalis gambiensis TaxID=67801 RepID=A0A1B0AN71_9MUSC
MKRVACNASQAGKTAKYINTYGTQQHQGIAKFTFPFGNETILGLSWILSVVTITKFVKFVEFLLPLLLLLLLLLWLLYSVVAMRTFLLTPLIPTSVAVIVIQALQRKHVSKTNVCKISIFLVSIFLRTFTILLSYLLPEISASVFPLIFQSTLALHEKHNSIEICIKYSFEVNYNRFI